MNALLEVGIVVAAGGLAVAFLVRQVVRALGSKRPSCCSGGPSCAACVEARERGAAARVGGAEKTGAPEG